MGSRSTHGANDAQKTMGVIALALYAHGSITTFYIPTWVKIAAGVAIGAGTYAGGWRIMRTLGQRVFQIDPPAGFAAQATAGAVIYASTRYGYPLSTTHVVSGAVMGSGATKRLSAVRWGVAGNIVFAWVLTIPAAAVVVAAIMWWPIKAIFGMKLGLGPRSGEIHVLLQRAGVDRARCCACRRAPLPDWPTGPSQDEVKELEHQADRVVSELISTTNSMFVTPYDREDLITLAFKIDDVADAAENAAELLGLYGIESPTRQSLELCELLVRATEELAALLGELKGAHGSSPRVVAIKEIEDRGTMSPALLAPASSRTTASTLGS